ncbi:DUF550 domain-containing protein [Salmonella enterica subsp. diarizonae]|nr:DUF550 domain-containing protein [Salmonella enterica subsp. diarizonae]
MTTITKEWLQQTIAEFENTRDDIPFGLSDDDAKILKVLKQALASFEAEPVGEFYHEKQDGWYQISEGDKVPDNRRIPLYTAPPVPERKRIRREHAEWSDKTFGDVGPIGPLKHLSKEALEAAAEPDDLSEWADMQFLLWDAQRRAGITDEQITQAMTEKLAINKARQWPEPKDDEPRLHIKEQPAPVVPDEITSTSAPEVFEIAAEAERIGLRGSYASYAVGWNACRAAMLQAGTLTNEGTIQAGNLPVIPDGWVMVPKKLTAENGAKSLLSGEFLETTFISCPECFADEECESCDGSGRIKIEVPVSWTTIKAIWNKGVEHFVAAPQQGTTNL